MFSPKLVILGWKKQRMFLLMMKSWTDLKYENWFFELLLILQFKFFSDRRLCSEMKRFQKAFVFFSKGCCGPGFFLKLCCVFNKPYHTYNIKGLVKTWLYRRPSDLRAVSENLTSAFPVRKYTVYNINNIRANYPLKLHWVCVLSVSIALERNF